MHAELVVFAATDNRRVGVDSTDHRVILRRVTSAAVGPITARLSRLRVIRTCAVGSIRLRLPNEQGFIRTATDDRRSRERGLSADKPGWTKPRGCAATTMGIVKLSGRDGA